MGSWSLYGPRKTESVVLCKKCPYSELCWSAFSRVRTVFLRIQLNEPCYFYPTVVFDLIRNNVPESVVLASVFFLVYLHRYPS